MFPELHLDAPGKEKEWHVLYCCRLLMRNLPVTVCARCNIATVGAVFMQVIFLVLQRVLGIHTEILPTPSTAGEFLQVPFVELGRVGYITVLYTNILEKGKLLSP